MLNMLRHSVCNCYGIRKILQLRFLYSTCTDTHTEGNPLILKLMKEFNDISYITEALQNKELNNIHFEEWKSRIYELKRYHFTDAECFKIISNYPYLLKVPLENFESSLKQWYQSNFEFSQFQYIILNQPQLIDIDEAEIRRRLPQLRVYFKSSKSLCNLLIVSPNTMFDNWITLMEKLHYVIKERGFNTLEVIQSQVLSKPLIFIKFRLDLLEKCGIYKQDKTVIHKRNKYDKTKHKNPSLKAILNPNGKQFIKVAKISHEEYSVYKSLYFDQENDDDDEEEDDKSSYN